MYIVLAVVSVVKILKFFSLGFLLATLGLLIHHFFTHGYLFDIHDVMYLKIQSHEFWEFILFTTSLLLHFIADVLENMKNKG